MTYVHDYSSPVGKILLAANEDSLTGLWFYGAKYFAAGLESERTEMLTPVLEQTMQWLDVYFSGSEPDFVPPLEMHGSAFQRSVWAELMKIPYGQTSSYGEIALRLGVQRTGDRRSSGAQSNINNSAVPPSPRCGRKPDRLCSRS